MREHESLNLFHDTIFLFFPVNNKTRSNNVYMDIVWIVVINSILSFL